MSISGATTSDVGGLLEVRSERSFEFPRAVAMDDSERGRSLERSPIQCSHDMIQRLVGRLPAYIDDRLLVGVVGTPCADGFRDR